MKEFAFFLVGSMTGIGSVLMLLRFDAKLIKSISLSGGIAALVAEFLVLADALSIESSSKPTMLVFLTLGWLITSVTLVLILLRLFKRQETNYRIHTWEILLGNKTAIDDYYSSKKKEIDALLEEKYGLKEMKAERANLEKFKKELESKAAASEHVIEQAEGILCNKHKIVVPCEYRFPVKTEFFELLPRYISLVSEFSHQLKSFTNSTLKDIKASSDQVDDSEALEAFLRGVGYYIGECLFEWRDVRVHFRKLNKETMEYEKFIALHKSGVDYEEELTPIASGSGLIALAENIKRSLVFSANRDMAIETSNSHIWKDYITMVFEKLSVGNKPALSLGISVKHHHDHKEMMYFLSYIQVEQIIQDSLVEVDKILPIPQTIYSEVE